MEYIFYKIICNDENINFKYIGSTRNFTTRKHNHKSACKNPEKNKLKIYKTINENGGFDNWSIYPIGKGMFENKIDAKIEEQKYINEYKADLNTFKAIMTKEDEDEYKKQYVLNNYSKVLESKKKYRDKHKDELKQKYLLNHNLHIKRKEKIMCNCGGSYTYTHKAEHLKSKKHINFQV